MHIAIANVLSAEETKHRARHARAHTLHRGAGNRGLCGAHGEEQPAGPGSDRSLETVRKLVAERILGNELFFLAARPKALSPLLFSRYEPGMQYGSHVDDALMGGMRTDCRSRCSCPTRRATTAASSSSTARPARRRSSSRPAASSPIPRPRSIAWRRDARHQARRGRLGAQLRPRSGAARAAVRSRHRATAAVRARGQIGRIRPHLQVVRQSAADVGRGLKEQMAEAGDESRGQADGGTDAHHSERGGSGTTRGAAPGSVGLIDKVRSAHLPHPRRAGRVTRSRSSARAPAAAPP